MRSEKDITNLIKEFKVTPPAGQKDAVLSDALQIQRERGCVTNGSYIMSHKLTSIAAALVIIIGVFFALNRGGVPIDGASIAWAEIVETMKAQQWIHAVVNGNTDGKESKYEMWMSTTPCVTIVKEEGGEILLCDYQENVRQSYKYQDNTVTIAFFPADMNFSLLLAGNPIELVDLIFENALADLPTITQENQTINGKEVLVITGKGKDKETVLVKDVQTGLLLSGSSKIQDRYESFEFDYPSAGPMSIYDVGVPQDARVVDSRPAGNVKDLMDILARKRKDGIGDFQAAIYQSQMKDGVFIPIKLVIMQGMGNLKRMEWYYTFDPAIRKTEMKTIFGLIGSKLSEYSLDAALAIDAPESIQTQALYDGKETVTCGRTIPDWGKVHRESIRMDTFVISEEWIPAVIWKNPGGLMGNTVGDMKMMEPDEPDHAGLVGVAIQVNFTNYTTNQPAVRQEVYWFDPARNYAFVEESSSSQDSFRNEKVLEFAQTENGNWYPSVIQVRSGKNQDDPEMRISQQNIVITTNPQFKPGIFTQESLIQDTPVDKP